MINITINHNILKVISIKQIYYVVQYTIYTHLQNPLISNFKKYNVLLYSILLFQAL